MDDKEFSLQDDDREKIKIAVRLHTPIEISSYTLPKNMEVYIYEVLSEFLSECHQEHMTEYLKFCVGELLNNAKKANTKRIYFLEKNLDINNELDYNEGMVFFKDETLMNIDYFLEKQKKAGLYVKLVLQVSDDYITIEIKNNSVLTKFESIRIQEKLKIAQQYDSIDDVFTKVLDQTEGAGLGIIIIILMLQKIGLSKDNYKVISTDTETITRIELPLNELVQEQLESLSETFIDSQDTIPVLDENLDGLKKKINTPNLLISELMDDFSKDQALAFYLLSEVSKINPNCKTLSEALDIIGLEKIKELFTGKNPKLRVIPASDELRELWIHGYYVAFYAYNLAKNFAPKTDVTPEQIYVCALLHDIECIFQKVATPDQIEFIEHKSVLKKIPNQVLQMFYSGKCHSKSGSMLSEAWGLPSEITDVIRFHNNPSHAYDSCWETTAYVYLADIIQYYKVKKVEFYQLNKEILDYFGIDSETKLNYIVDQIKSIL